MKLSTLGHVKIEAIPMAENPAVLKVLVRSANRTETIEAVTQSEENTDQFCKRLMGMMRALMQSEVKAEPVEEKKGKKAPVGA